jgi:hypothetical protein
MSTFYTFKYFTFLKQLTTSQSTSCSGRHLSLFGSKKNPSSHSSRQRQTCVEQRQYSLQSASCDQVDPSSHGGPMVQLESGQKPVETLVLVSMVVGVVF